jgi:uncharacterized protein YejL (UPF0352 family)
VQQQVLETTVSWLHRHPSEVDLTLTELGEVYYVGQMWQKVIHDVAEAIIRTIARSGI